MGGHGAVLILDDDVDILRASRLAIASHVERVDILQSPDNLEERLVAAQFDVVLLDMNFVTGARSGRDGMHALARIRAFDNTLAVILMTAYGGVSLAIEALKSGATDFILKPWHNDKLVAAVTAAVNVAHSRRAVENLNLDMRERSTVERALAQFGGNISAAANALGLSRAALYRRMTKYGL